MESGECSQSGLRILSHAESDYVTKTHSQRQISSKRGDPTAQGWGRLIQDVAGCGVWGSNNEYAW